MKVYAMVQKGNREGKINCDDRALVGKVVLDQGYYETDTDNTNTVLAVSDGVGGSPAGWKAAEHGLRKEDFHRCRPAIVPAEAGGAWR